MDAKKIIILSVSVGQGHHQVSRALSEELYERGIKTEIIDLFQFVDGAYSQKLKNIYFHFIRFYPFIWESIFMLTENRFIQKVIAPIVLYLWKDFFTYCKKREVTSIVTTHPLATFLGINLKRRLKKPVSIYAVLSDFATHGLSISPHLDGLFVATEEEQKKLSAKYPDLPIYSYGIPLRKVWDEVLNKQLIRKQLNLPLYDRIIVLSGGGEGVLPYGEIIEKLAKDKKKSSIIAFLGINDERKEQGYFLTNGSFVQFLPYSFNYYEFVMASDLLISKPGGVTMAEAIRLGIPTLIYSALPGQEKKNEAILMKKYKLIQPLYRDVHASEYISQYKHSVKQSSKMRDARKNIVDKIIELDSIVNDEKFNKNKARDQYGTNGHLDQEESFFL